MIFLCSYKQPVDILNRNCICIHTDFLNFFDIICKMIRIIITNTKFQAILIDIICQ